MKKIPRRDKLKIYGDLLSVLKSEGNEGERVILTRVQVQINVPFDRLKNYITELRELDLIEDETLNLTKKGKQYIMEYEKVIEFMKRMGLTY